MKKIILIDSSSISFRSILNYMTQLEKNKGSNKFIDSPQHSYYISLISRLKKIGVDNNTIMIVALEGKSWRKNFYGPYKANRPDYTAWKPYFEKINYVNQCLEEATNWHFLRDWNSECDDIIAVACKYFKDDEKIIISSDGDLKQLCYYPNTNFFASHIKCKGSNGCFIKVDNPLNTLATKIRVGDKGDNIIVEKGVVYTEEDVALRTMIIDLLNLPEFVEKPIRELLSNLPKKELNLDKLPNFKNCKEKFLQIYDDKYKVTPEYCYSLLEKRVERKKKEKAKK